MGSEIESAESASTAVEAAPSTQEGVAQSSPSPAPARAALEAKVKAGLAEVFQTSEADEPADEQEPQEEGNQPADEQPDAEQQEETSQEDEEAAAAEKPKVEKPKADTKTPILPAAIVRSLKAYEWTDEEIAEAAKNPGFLVAATKIHATRNAETAKWAEIGRKERANQQAAQSAQPDVAGLAALKPVDVAKLKEQYGDDKLIDALVGPMNSLVTQINAILPTIQETQQAAARAELDTLGREIEGFLGSEELKPYADVYGNAKSKLTQEQIAARNKWLEAADALSLGAKLQGRELSVKDALAQAHDFVSGEFKVQAARTELTAKVRQRGKALSLRPSSRGPQTPSSSNAPKTRAQLEAATKQRLRSVFNS